MRKHVQIFHSSSQLIDSQRSLNIAFDSMIESRVEIYRGRTVNQNIAFLDHSIHIFLRKTEIFFGKIAVYRLNLGINELIEFMLVDVPNTVETWTTEYFFFESFQQRWSFFATDQHVDHFNFGQTIQNFFEEDFTKEPRSPSD